MNPRDIHDLLSIEQRLLEVVVDLEEGDADRQPLADSQRMLAKVLDDAVERAADVLAAAEAVVGATKTDIDGTRPAESGPPSPDADR